MNKLRKTNERCYICDFHSPVDEDPNNPGFYTTGTGDHRSLYFDSLSENNQDATGRYVFIHPRDGKPICSICNREVVENVKWMELKDRDFDPEDFTLWDVSIISRADNEHLPYQTEDGGWNIDWDKIERNDNNTIKFPLPLKDPPRLLNWNTCTRASQFPLTPEDHVRINEIRAEKGYIEDDSNRVNRNKRMEDHCHLIEPKPGLAPCSGWPIDHLKEKT